MNVLVFRPTNASPSLLKLLSPLVASIPVEVFASTTLADPPAEVTTPETWPATPSPDVALADWLTVARLLPSWALLQPVPALRHESTKSAIVRSPENVRFRPTNALRSLFASLSPVVTSEFFDVLAATTLAEPPAEVTTPMT